MRFFISALLVFAKVISVQLSSSSFAETSTTEQGLQALKHIASVTLCLGSYPRGGCAKFPITDDKCINFSRGKVAFYRTVSTVRIEARYACALNFACEDEPSEIGIMSGGLYDLKNLGIPNGYGYPIDFDEAAASIACRRLSKIDTT